MDTRHAFAKALKELRMIKGLTQEDFSEVSSRAYISLIERGLRCPTLDKVDEFAGVLGVHPMALLCLAYLYADFAEDQQDLEQLLNRIRTDISQ